uniref:polysaccharide biosynthesis protein n=1 Tax=Parabacteroides distasonis TaxID=823 RepID=UPI0022E78B1B
KRICEIYVQSLDQAIKDGKVRGRTQFVTTRFGNVLGSNGSVIPLFKEQIKRGGPVTVTHKDIIRKRICEIYVQSLDQAIKDGKVSGRTQFVTTRFGNVLGSNGSVIPLFKEQIKRGGPVTVTHKDIIRFFMLIPEACKLVLEAGTMGNGGEIFVFDMGKPVRIVDLAERMIRLSGVKGIEIRFTGLRDGEKLYEEVLNEEETSKPTFHPKIKIAQVRAYDYADANLRIDALVRACVVEGDMQIVKRMKEIVPEFKSQHSKYEVLDK